MITTYCVICREPIPEVRAKRKSDTCTDEHKKLLKKARRADVDSRRCRACFRPSTPEQKKSFREWARTQPDLQPKKRGRKTSLPKADAVEAGASR